MLPNHTRFEELVYTETRSAFPYLETLTRKIRRHCVLGITQTPLVRKREAHTQTGKKADGLRGSRKRNRHKDKHRYEDRENEGAHTGGQTNEAKIDEKEDRAGIMKRWLHHLLPETLTQEQQGGSRRSAVRYAQPLLSGR